MGVSNMPPIHSSVLILAVRFKTLVGSKADMFGGTKWRTPGWELAGGLDGAMMAQMGCRTTAVTS